MSWIAPFLFGSALVAIAASCGDGASSSTTGTGGATSSASIATSGSSGPGATSSGSGGAASSTSASSGAGGSMGNGGSGGAPCGSGGGQSYSTTFDGDENPISECGVWSHLGMDWAVVQKSGGLAFGTQTGNDGYNDSYALLSGFNPDQTASAVIHLNPAIDGSCTHEVELLLRWSDAAHSAKGYECNLSFDGGYLQIVRWNGALGDFTVLGGGSMAGLEDGDTFEASIIGDMITESVNGVQVVQLTDSSYPTGNPGIGFFRRNCGANSDFGYQSYTVTAQ